MLIVSYFGITSQELICAEVLKWIPTLATILTLTFDMILAPPARWTCTFITNLSLARYVNPLAILPFRPIPEQITHHCRVIETVGWKAGCVMCNSKTTIMNLTFCDSYLNQTTPNRGREVSFSRGRNLLRSCGSPASPGQTASGHYLSKPVSIKVVFKAKHQQAEKTVNHLSLFVIGRDTNAPRNFSSGL